ncbi:hypothetical protein [Methylobacterium sp. WL1]|uniref:hypothetical protein n=1 Tax=Methylobacterium sp. WL1 TaxID=2603276 RepID=UPI00165065E0|nr:hypothetical protein [Methylobacterium sp. WL1]
MPFRIETFINRLNSIQKMNLGYIMSALRYILLGLSVLSLAVVLVFWTVSGHVADLGVFLVAAFLVANSVYILFSRPTLRASSVFDRAATGLAFASLELQHQAKEAKIREAEAERIRAQEAEQNKSKLRAAEEFISYVRQNPLMRGRQAVTVKQITLLGDPKSIALPTLELPRPVPSELNGRHRADPGATNVTPPAPPPAPCRVWKPDRRLALARDAEPHGGRRAGLRGSRPSRPRERLAGGTPDPIRHGTISAACGLLSWDREGFAPLTAQRKTTALDGGMRGNILCAPRSSLRPCSPPSAPPSPPRPPPPRSAPAPSLRRPTSSRPSRWIGWSVAWSVATWSAAWSGVTWSVA